MEWGVKQTTYVGDRVYILTCTETLRLKLAGEHGIVERIYVGADEFCLMELRMERDGSPRFVLPNWAINDAIRPSGN